MIEWLVLAGMAWSFSESTTVNAVVTEQPISGCYAQTERIYSTVDDESSLQQSYLRIEKQGERYVADGLIWGANFHICQIGSPDEGTPGPLVMTRQGNRLQYAFSDAQYGIDCQFEILITAEGLRLSDPNNHCTSQVFYCGARVALDGIELPVRHARCPEAEY